MSSFGTNESICRIVDQYSRMLQKLALTRLPPTDAEDVVQEVFLKLMTARLISGMRATKKPGSSAPP